MKFEKWNHWKQLNGLLFRFTTNECSNDCSILKNAMCFFSNEYIRWFNVNMDLYRNDTSGQRHHCQTSIDNISDLWLRWYFSDPVTCDKIEFLWPTWCEIECRSMRDVHDINRLHNACNLSFDIEEGKLLTLKRSIRSFKRLLPTKTN